MKSMIAVLALLAFTQAAQAEQCLRSAQVIGTVVAKSRMVGCRVNLVFSYFKSSTLCPLSQKEASQLMILSETCPELGIEVSGVIEESDDGNFWLDQ